MTKVSKNLSLDEAEVARGERYSVLYDTKLSRFVSDFLAGLPIDEQREPHPPTVRHLTEIGTSHTVGPDAQHEGQSYRDYLDKKHVRT